MEFRFLPGALHSLAQLARTDFATIVITDQAIINRGLVTAKAIGDIRNRMLSDMRRVGGWIDQVLVCSHCADEVCDCRKPAPGLAAGGQSFLVMTRRGAGGRTASALRATCGTQSIPSSASRPSERCDRFQRSLCAGRSPAR